MLGMFARSGTWDGHRGREGQRQGREADATASPPAKEGPG